MENDRIDKESGRGRTPSLLLWPPGPWVPTVGARDVHLWAADLAGWACAFKGMALTDSLSANELDRANRFRFPGDRDRFVRGRHFLRTVLARYLRISPADVDLGYGENGKPFLAAGPMSDTGPRLEFNLSHTGWLAVMAVTQAGPVGVDVEEIRPVPEAAAIAARHWGEAIASDLDPLQFLRCWTRMEAAAKARGAGIHEPAAGCGPHPFVMDDAACREFQPAPGYIGALATLGGTPSDVQCWQCAASDDPWSTRSKLRRAQTWREISPHGSD